jgi:Arc/MetJ-type ribon-helix-helix transcriptional regulator
MGRRIKGADDTKSAKVTVRIDEVLRRQIEAFVKSGPFEGEELQVVIRMLMRQGLDVQERFKKVLEGIEKEITRKAASLASGKGRSSAGNKDG